MLSQIITRALATAFPAPQILFAPIPRRAEKAPQLAKSGAASPIQSAAIIAPPKAPKKARRNALWPALRSAVNDETLWNAIFRSGLKIWPEQDGKSYSLPDRSGPKWSRDDIMKSPFTVLKLLNPAHPLCSAKSKKGFIAFSGPNVWGQCKEKLLPHQTWQEK